MPWQLQTQPNSLLKPGRNQQKMVQVLGPMLPMWQIWMKLLASSFVLAEVWLLRPCQEWIICMFPFENVCLNPLPSFNWISSCFVIVFWVPYIFWIWISCDLCSMQIFSPVLYADFSLCCFLCYAEGMCCKKKKMWYVTNPQLTLYWKGKASLSLWDLE